MNNNIVVWDSLRSKRFLRFRRKERVTRVKDCEKSGASKRAGRGWGRKEGNARRQTPGF